jgi:hypothetical protein
MVKGPPPAGEQGYSARGYFGVRKDGFRIICVPSRALIGSELCAQVDGAVKGAAVADLVRSSPNHLNDCLGDRFAARWLLVCAFVAAGS